MSALLTFLLLTARDDTAEAKVIQDKLRGCGRSEGAVRFLWEGQQGAPMKAALAYACTKAGQTTVLVYAPLPSGQYGLVCDSVPLAGVAHVLEGKVFFGRTFLYVKTLASSPDEERVVEALFQPRWGKCTQIARSDVRHPDDGALLREPLAGFEFDEDGFDVLESVSRLQFPGESAVGPKRRVAMAMHGKRYDAKRDGAFESSDIVLEAVRSIPIALSGDRASFPRSLVRGVRARFLTDTLRVHVGEHHLSFSAKSQRWVVAPQLFGAGMLAKGDGAVGHEGVAFFDPPIELEEITFEGKAEQLIVFKDSEDWPLFEAQEDHGER